jgi:hypothetical protein
VRHTLLYLHGCSAGLVAMDIAENNRGTHVFVACAHAVLLTLGAPDMARLDALITMTLFTDSAGTGTVIVSDDPTEPVERPIFHMV